MIILAKLLTVAIQEMDRVKGDFKIVTYDIENRDFISSQLSKEDFFNRPGEVVWDLFAVTEVKEVIKKDWGEFSTFYDPEFRRYFTKKEMINFMRRNTGDLNDFIDDNTYDRYTIIPIISIDNIEVKTDRDNNLYTLISFKYNDQDEKYSNKDFRWINYWRQIPEDKWESKIEKWYSYINNTEKRVFLIMNNLWFPRGNGNFKKHTWISGFHCL